MLILQKGNRNTKSLAYTLLEGPILEYGGACWDSYTGRSDKRVRPFAKESG